MGIKYEDIGDMRTWPNVYKSKSNSFYTYLLDFLRLYSFNLSTSDLYRTKKINNEKKANPTNMIIKGVSIEAWIAGASVNLILAGWCNVFHHSTENLIIGILAKPRIATIDDIFSAVKKFFITFQDKI